MQSIYKHEFNYQTNEIIGQDEQVNKFYNIDLKYGDVLCLDLNDEKTRFRKVILEAQGGDEITGGYRHIFPFYIILLNSCIYN